MAPVGSTERTVAGVVTLGALLLGVVIARKLVGASYRVDVETMCDAEARSGRVLDRNMAEITRWERAHLVTSDGNALFASVRDMPIADRAPRLRREAIAAKIPVCPLADSLERLARDADYRLDVQHLCSRVDFAELAELDDHARLARLEDWIETQAKSPRAMSLAVALRRATPADRGHVLRAAAGDADVYSCAVAGVLDNPAPPSP